MRERDITAAQADEKRDSYCLWDDRIKGLALRVRKNSKTFVFKTKIAGRTRRIKIGRWGEITLTAARKIASQHIVEITSGGDPNERRHPGTSLQEVFP